MGDIIVREGKKGKKSYVARVRRKDQPDIVKTFKRRTDAQKFISTTEAKHYEGRTLTRSNRITVADAIDRYLEEIMPHKKPNTQAVEKTRLLFWRKRFQNSRLTEIRYEHLQKAREHLLKTPVERPGGQLPQKRGNATVNRYFAVLRHVYRVAIKNWQWAEDNPVARLTALPESRGRNRILSDVEMEAITEGLEAHERTDFRLIVKFALMTGCRRRNAEGVRWEHIDFENKTILFPDMKNGLPHVAPITDDFILELKTYRLACGGREGYLFPSREGSKQPFVDVKNVWIRFAKKLGLDDLRFHDLRHSVASHLAQQNVPLYLIGKLLGHQSLESTKRYAHIRTEDMVSNVELLEKRLKRVK